MSFEAQSDHFISPKPRGQTSQLSRNFCKSMSRVHDATVSGTLIRLRLWIVTYTPTCTVLIKNDNPKKVHILYVRKHTQQKKFLDTYKKSIFTKMLHIRQIKSLLCEAGECLLHFDTKVEGIG